MDVNNIILVWKQKAKYFPVHSGFVGSAQAALWHLKGWAGHKGTGDSSLYCQAEITPGSWPGGF